MKQPNRIRRFRLDLGLDVASFAALFGVQPSTVYRWEERPWNELRLDGAVTMILLGYERALKSGGEQVKACLRHYAEIGGLGAIVWNGVFELSKVHEIEMTKELR